MPASTAWLHAGGDEVSDRYIPRYRDHLTGLARVYKLGTPRDLDGDGILDEYVIIRILYRRETMHAEIALFPCDETGTLRGNSVMRRMGSFPLVPCPKDNPDAIEFAIGVAFKFYDIEVLAEAPEPEPEPEPEVEPETPAFPDGLDYDPSVVPTY
jgi:hypothetical protein